MRDDPANPRRRRILAAAGALAGASLLPGVAATHESDETNDGHDTGQRCNPHMKGGRLCTRPCADGDLLKKDKREHCDDSCRTIDWSDSAATFYNCSDCERRVKMRTSGSICDERYLTSEEINGLHERWTMDVESGEKVTLWFTGSLQGLDLDDADMNVAISQRAGHEDGCSRRCPEC